jgi:hypothetical protein
VSEQTESHLVFPMTTPIAHLAGRDTGTSQVEVYGLDNGNTHSSIDIATHFRVRFLPLSAKIKVQHSIQLGMNTGVI